MSGVFGRLRISDTFQETGSAELIPAPDDLAFFDFATNQYSGMTSVQGKHTLEYVHLFQPRNNVGRDLALQINGTNQVHFVHSKELLDWNAPHTIEMLFKWGAREQLGTLFSVGNFSLRTEVVEGNQTLLTRFQRESAQIPQSALLSRLPFNEYVHFAAQYDGTKMYVSINGKRLLGIDALEESSIPCDPCSVANYRVIRLARRSC